MWESGENPELCRSGNPTLFINLEPGSPKTSRKITHTTVLLYNPEQGIMNTERLQTQEYTHPQEQVRIPERRSRPALDLTEEAKKARKHGMAYLPDFLRQMRSFGKETDSTGRMFMYEHVIKRTEAGEVQLYITEGNELVPARESYLRPAWDPKLPAWERRRNYREYEAICSMEEMLSRAQPGDSFVEASHAPFDVAETELDGTCYGKFSFFRVHTLLQNGKGEEVLVGKQVLNYLDWETQRELFAVLTRNPDITREELFGAVGRLNPSEGHTGIQSIEDVALLINSISDEHKLETDDTEPVRSEEEVDRFLKNLTWSEQTFLSL
jgi:hypothetical protein